MAETFSRGKSGVQNCHRMDSRQRMHGDMPVKFTSEIPAAVELYQAVRGQPVTALTLGQQQQHPLTGGYGTDEAVKHQRADR